MISTLTPSSCRRAAPALPAFPARAVLAAALATALVLGLAARPAHAERADRDKPLVLEADNASYDDVKQIYTLTGNVILTKGTMVLKSDAAELRTDPEGYQFAVATSKPGRQAYIRQKREGLDEYIDGWGDRIEYDGKQEMSKLIGHARMIRLAGAKTLDEIRGAVLTYDSRNEFYTAAGGGDNSTTGNPSGRVRAVLSPRQEQPASAPGASAPAGAPLNLRPAPAPSAQP
jgi:lipopolysaccharide export system protein LptA